MANPVLDVITQGANAVNQASANTTNTLSLLQRNVEAQAQARQFYTQQQINALTQFQQAQMAENQLMVQKTFDIQNRYLDTLAKTNSTYFDQVNKVLDLDLRIEQMKQDKKYKDAMIKIETAKQDSYAKLVASQIGQIKLNMKIAQEKLPYELEYRKSQIGYQKALTQKTLKETELLGTKKTEPIVQQKDGTIHPKDVKKILSMSPENAVKSIATLTSNLKGIVEFNKIRQKYKTQNGIDLVDYLIQQNPQMANILDKRNVLKTYKTKDGKVKTILNTENKILNSFIVNTFKAIGSGDVSIDDAIDSLNSYLNMLNLDDDVKNKIATNVILKNVNLTKEEQFKKILPTINQAINNIKLSNTNETRLVTDSLSTFIKNNKRFLFKNEYGKAIFEKLFNTLSTANGIPDMLQDEHKFNEVIQRLKGHTYNIPGVGYLGDYLHGVKTLKQTLDTIQSNFGSKKAFLGYLMFEHINKAKEYGADPLKTIKEPTKDIGILGSLDHLFDDAKLKLTSKEIVDKVVPNSLLKDEEWQQFRKTIPLEVASVANLIKQGKDVNELKKMVKQKIRNFVYSKNLYLNATDVDGFATKHKGLAVMGFIANNVQNLLSSNESINEKKKTLTNLITEAIIKDAFYMLKNKKIKNKLASYSALSSVWNEVLNADDIIAEQNRD